jgi:hypothetical protein
MSIPCAVSVAGATQRGGGELLLDPRDITCITPRYPGTIQHALTGWSPSSQQPQQAGKDEGNLLQTCASNLPMWCSTAGFTEFRQDSGSQGCA